MKIKKACGGAVKDGRLVCAKCNQPVGLSQAAYIRAQGIKEYREYFCSCGKVIKLWMEEEQ